MVEQIDSDVIVSAVQFWQKVYTEKIVKIRFTKKDGNDRIMSATLDFTKIPKEDHPKTVNIQKILSLIQKNQIMHVYDLDAKGWRSVPFNRVEYLQTLKGKRFYVQSKKKEMESLTKE
jgi:hypothetical protein